MRFLPECYACAMRQALSASRLVSDDVDFQHRCLREAAEILSAIDPDQTPPQVGEKIYGAVNRFSGNPDPFREQKRSQNSAVEKLLPWLRETVDSAPDPLLMAVRLSAAGNAVDPGAQESFELERSVMEAVEEEGELSDYPAFKRGIEGTDRLLFIADNCGEIIFDKVLIETILGIKDMEVVLAVRGGPIINDVTEAEAAELGMDETCTVITSGLKMPGTLLPGSSERFKREFEQADLVIAKGQGNWETLDDSPREIFFILQAKCQPVAEMNSCKVGQLLLIRCPGGR